jgi:hypothetical protein
MAFGHPANTAAATLAIAVWLLAGSGCQSHKAKAALNLFVYSQSDIRRCLRRIGCATFEYDRVERNGDGTQLRIWGSSCASKSVLVLRLDGRAVTTPTVGDLSYLNDAGDVVAWYDFGHRAMIFRDRTAFRPWEFGFFGVDRGGRYFFVQLEPRVTSVGPVDRPKNLFRISDFEAREIFASGNRVYLFEMGGPAVRCAVVEESQMGFSLAAEITIPRPGGSAPTPYYVEDMDTRSGRVLLRDVFDKPFPSYWYLFDFNTRRIEKIGRAKHRAFFLLGDVLRAVETYPQENPPKVRPP